jgi:two-component system NtrC family sensor kinase
VPLPNGERLLQLINPIYNNRSCVAGECHPSTKDQKILGVLDMFISLKEIDQKTRAIQNRWIAISAFSIILISSIIFVYIRRQVVKPIKELIMGTKIISSGNLDYQLPVHRNDEIGTLSKSFNRMNNTLSETRNQLLQSEKLASLGKLAAGVAHEINNPLTGVMLYTSSMMSDLPEDDPNREKFEIVINETKRCREIVKELLDFSRQTAPDKTMGNIREIIERILRIIHNQLVLKKLNVIEDYGSDVPEFPMDDNKISQAILNLLINAVEATPEGGEIRVSTSLNSHNQATITIADNGKGISREHLNRIFEPFYTTKGTKGIGLGLAVTWGIISQHEGDIKVDSTEGKGTTFTIYLPVKESNESPGR